MRTFTRNYRDQQAKHRFWSRAWHAQQAGNKSNPRTKRIFHLELAR